jgi:hypothetical protein
MFQVYTCLTVDHDWRLVKLLVDRVDISERGADVALRIDGLSSLMQDMRTAAAPNSGAA